MITEEKIKQVQKRLRKGEPEGELKNELKKAGYTDEDLALIFVAYKPDMRSYYLFFAIVFLLIGMYKLIVNGGFLFLLFSVAMFSVYYVENNKHKKSA